MGSSIDLRNRNGCHTLEYVGNYQTKELNWWGVVKKDGIFYAPVGSPLSNDEYIMKRVDGQKLINDNTWVIKKDRFERLRSER